ncbi:DUF2182 domain-containing protein [Chryseobacterium sp. T20]|uniref:copper chaperone n=1 Tax=Chryseobacterium sp. T20 TaxID=3395375 RepID=UPI0039BCE384
MIKKILWTVSIITWIILLFNPGNIMTIEHCHVSSAGSSMQSFEMLLEMNPISNQLLGWTLMVIAMMLPKLISHLELLSFQTLSKYRFTNCLNFIVGYLATWSVVGFGMVWIIIGLNLKFPNSFVPAIIVGVLTLIWQFSPWKQIFLNKCHKQTIVSSRFLKGIYESFKYGAIHGLYCVGAGWGLMLFPMLLPVGHNLAMILVTIIMLTEHMEHPRVPKWEINFRLKFYKFIWYKVGFVK